MINFNAMQNPLFQLMEMSRKGIPAIRAVEQIAMQGNPQMRQFFQTIKGKTPQELQKMAENVATERGLNIQDVARKLGI